LNIGIDEAEIAGPKATKGSNAANCRRDRIFLKRPFVVHDG